MRMGLRVRERSISACSIRGCSARQHMQRAAKSHGWQCLIISAATSAGTPKSTPPNRVGVSGDELPPLSETPSRVRRLLLGFVLGARLTVSVDGGVSVELDARERMSLSVPVPIDRLPSRMASVCSAFAQRSLQRALRRHAWPPEKLGRWVIRRQRDSGFHGSFANSRDLLTHDRAHHSKACKESTSMGTVGSMQCKPALAQAATFASDGDPPLQMAIRWRAPLCAGRCGR